MAGFNINIGDGNIGPANSNDIPQGEEIKDIPKQDRKGRLILEKRIRDFEKAVDKLQIRLKSQVLTAGAMAQQRARAAKTPERLDEIVSGMAEKQNNRIQGLEVDLMKSFDAIKTWIKTTGGNEEDLAHVKAIYDELESGNLADAPGKVQEIMDALKEVSQKEMVNRAAKKEQAEKDLEAKRTKRKTDHEDAKFQKQRLEQLKASAKVEADLAKREYLASRASELEMSPFEAMTDFIDRVLLMGRRGKVSGSGHANRQSKILEEAEKAAQKKYNELTASNVPSPEEVARGERSLARGESPVPPPVNTKASDDAVGSKASAGSLFAKVAAIVAVAAIVDQAISRAISSAGKKARDLTSGDPGTVTGAATGADIPFNYVGKVLTEIVSTLDNIAKNTEQKTLPFSPELINASINKQLLFLDMNIQRGEKLGSVLADISKSRTMLEASSQRLADKLIETFGPTLSAIMEGVAFIVDATTLVVDLYKNAIARMDKGGSIFSSTFWTSVFSEAMKDAQNRNKSPQVIGDVEAFLNNKQDGPGGRNTNTPIKGIFQ
jgi:hypothetical protein